MNRITSGSDEHIVALDQMALANCSSVKMVARAEPPPPRGNTAERTTDRPRYRRISTRIWGDDRFLRLSKPQPNAQTLWFFLLTGACTRAIPGLFPAGERALAEMLNWPMKGFRRAWRELEQLGMVKADWAHRLVWIPKAVRHNPPENPNIVTGWRSILDETHECGLRTEALTALRDYCQQSCSEAFLEAFDKAFGQAFRRPSDHPSPKHWANQEPDQETGNRTQGPRAPDHSYHAACDETHSRCVPRAVHDKLKDLLAPKHGGDRTAAGEALVAWYPTVWATLPRDFVMPDAFKFWQPRFDAAFASKLPQALPSAEPPRNCDHIPPCRTDLEHGRCVRAETEPATSGSKAR